MHDSERGRCGAKTRSGSPCKLPPVTGKRRCRMHGGATGSGGQPGNGNAHKHGHYSATAIEARRQIRHLLREAARTIEPL